LTIATVRTSNPTKSNQIRIATQEEKHSNIDKGEKDEEKRDDDDDDDDVVVMVVVVVLVDPDCIQNGSVHAVETNRPVDLWRQKYDDYCS